MPKRSSRKKTPKDTNELATFIVEQATTKPEEPAKQKNPNAVALGKLGGKKGGPARANKLTPRQRREIAQKAARTRWEQQKGKDYEKFRAPIERILKRTKKPLTWAEIKEQAGFGQKVPNNKWVKWLEEDIELIREKTKEGKTVWRLG